jgi:hypothetical protein
MLKVQVRKILKGRNSSITAACNLPTSTIPVFHPLLLGNPKYSTDSHYLVSFKLILKCPQNVTVSKRYIRRYFASYFQSLIFHTLNVK